MNPDNHQIPPAFRIYTGKDIDRVIQSDRQAIIDAVENAYRAHYHGWTVNPDSYFLRFPDNDANRIIALPAHYHDRDGGGRITGIKWIASFPGNIACGLPRASGVLILNDGATGYPVACLEASIISAARTAASAASALRCLNGGAARVETLAVIGTGLISRYIIDFIAAAGIEVGAYLFHDLDRRHAQALADGVARRHGARVGVMPSLDAAVRAADVVVFATTASQPHVGDAGLLAHKPIILHISLRDLAPDLLLSSYNIVDDVEHCLKARTSPHLAEMLTGRRDFVTASLPAILCGAAKPPPRDKPVIFSPFGMGVLDLAVGALVCDSLQAHTAPIDDFFFDLKRA